MGSFRIHTKFLVLILGIIVVFLGILSLVMVRRETHLLVRKSAETEQLLAQTIVADLKDSMLSGRPRSTLALMEGLRGSHDMVQVEVLRRDGTPAFGIGGPPLRLPQLEQVFRDGRELDLTVDGDPPQHTDLFPLRNEPACRRCHALAGEVLGAILLTHSLKDVAAETRANRRQLTLLIAGIVLVMGVVLYVSLNRMVLAPLKALHEGADVIGKGGLGHRIPVTGRDEFAELATAFNVMADHLKETYTGLENKVKIRTAELNESVRLMRGILSSMSSGVVLLDREGRVKIINRHGANLLGRSPEELLGRHLVTVVPETAGFFVGRIGSYEEVEVTAGGSRIPLGFTVSPYPGGEAEQEGIIVVFQDLTELKTLQNELINKERFASVGRVVAGVAHEIRNPLFGISAIGQIFERDLTDPGQHELARALLGETRRLNQLVEELLIYGRPMKLKLEKADLRVLWEEVLDLHQEELRSKNIQIRGEYSVRHPVVTFDVYQVRQVFLNLLRNAIEATPEGGTIAITMLVEDRYILFQLADTGTGIPADDLAHVFDLFYTTKPKGTGLGLAICRKIMQDHGGEIGITSVVGSGTTVTIKLPYHQPSELRLAEA